MGWREPPSGVQHFLVPFQANNVWVEKSLQKGGNCRKKIASFMNSGTGNVETAESF